MEKRVTYYTLSPLIKDEGRVFKDMFSFYLYDLCYSKNHFTNNKYNIHLKNRYRKKVEICIEVHIKLNARSSF